MNDAKEALHAIEYEARQNQSVRCENDAPHIAVLREGKWTVYQGCCNSWECERCGFIRARNEYHRLRYGCQNLWDKSVQLWMITLTSPGQGTDIEAAEQNWYNGTMKTLNALRNQYKRGGGENWYYACVTERQKRGHPHAHYIITAVPKDLAWAAPGATLRDGRMNHQASLQSDWLVDRLDVNRMGTVYDIQPIDDAAKVSAYVSKYLFKSLLQEKWPKGWRRVRYSRNWVKAGYPKAEQAIALLGAKQWDELGRQGPNVVTDDAVVLEHWQAWRAPNIKLRRTK